MLFQVAAYVIVYFSCLALFCLVRSHRVRQIALLVANYLLYLSWGWWFACILAFSTLVNFALGKKLRRDQADSTLGLGIAINVVILGTFKYLPELGSSLTWEPLHFLVRLALPLGISFWTFQALSFLFDQYRGEDLDPSIIEFAVYMSFFPVVISGPVCRMVDMLPQFRSEERPAWGNFVEGMRRVLIGLFMMQVARLLGNGAMGGEGIDAGFHQATQWGGPDVWLLGIGYGLRLYFDFAGFTSIVIGAAKGLGMVVPENFNHPFRSTSPSIFWTRWHMSLSFWIRDYVFLPAAMIRREVWWRYFALFASMVVFGIWHKGTLLFVLWGAFHGALLVVHRLWQGLVRRWNLDTSAPIWEPISWICTMAPISLAWILFSQIAPEQVAKMFTAVVTPSSYAHQYLGSSVYLLVFAVMAICACYSQVRQMLEDAQDQEASGVFAIIAKRQDYWVPALYIVAFVAVYVMASGQGNNAAALMYRAF